MGNNIVYEYESQMKDLIREFRNLNGSERKNQFSKYVRKEADIFAGLIDKQNISSISESTYNTLLEKRTIYIKKLFDYKDVCLIF